MSQVRFNFLNWRPDAEDFGNEGLVTADNVIHESEGFKPAHLESAAAFSTTGGLAATTATILSVCAKPVGSQGDLLVAWITDQTATSLHVGINGVTATTAATGYPLTFSTVYAGSTTTPVAISVFDVCEYGGKILWTVEAQMGTTTPSTTLSISFAGYMDY